VFSEPDRVSGRVEVTVWDVLSAGSGPGEAGQRVTHPQALENLRGLAWAGCSSAAAPEIRGISFRPGVDGEAPGLRKERVSSVCVSPADGGQSLVCAGYEDGGVQVFSFPAVEAAPDCVQAAVHARGPVFAVFAGEQGASRTVVSVGATDGVLAVWRISLLPPRE